MSLAARAVAVTVTMNALATIFVGLNVVSRFTILKRSAVNDYLLLIAVCSSWALTALIIMQARYGLGQHFDQVSPEEFLKTLLPFWISILAYAQALTLTKLSALLRFLQFFISQKTRMAAWFLIAIVSAQGVASLVASVCSCLPIAFFWNKAIAGGKCFDLLVFWYFCAAFSILTDIAIVGLPLYVLKDLHLPPRQKLAVTGVFAIAGLTCVIAILRLHSIYVVATSKDPTWDNANAAMWSAVEVNISIICATMPSLKPLIQKVAPRFLSSEVSTKSKGASDSSILVPLT